MMVAGDDAKLEGLVLAEKNVHSHADEAPITREASLERLELSTYIMNRLTDAQLETVGDLWDRLEHGPKIDGIGDESAKEIRKELLGKGFLPHVGAVPDVDRGQPSADTVESADPRETGGTAAAEETPGTAPSDAKQPVSSKQEKGEEQRISFALRVTVDERGEPKRTEIEHPQSQRKKHVQGLDLQELESFMKECISPPIAVRASAAPELLTISEVQVLRAGARGGETLGLKPGEAFEIRVRFLLRDADVKAMTSHCPSYQVQVYAKEAANGTSALLTTHDGHLTEGCADYAPRIVIPGLPRGLFRLLTMVTLLAPNKGLVHRDGPSINVA
jgi:hypothetical protein